MVPIKRFGGVESADTNGRQVLIAEPEKILPVVRTVPGNRVLAGFNDLASRFPEIAAEWSEKNYPLRPDEVTAFSNKKAWWKRKMRA